MTDWSHATVYRGPLAQAPKCVVCGKPALLTHPVLKVPHHKVCE